MCGGKKMKIQYLGHACFRIISSLGTAIVCDPYNEKVGFNLPKVSCDVVTVSHRHEDHDCLEAVSGNPAVLEKEVCLAVDDVAVQSLKCWHDDKGGKLRGENFVFCFLVDGLKVVHMGDVGELNEDLAKRLYRCDVLLLPVGGVYTVDATGAKWYVDKIQPKITIPMHYKSKGHNFEIDGVEKFTKLFDPAKVKFLPYETLVLEDVPQEESVVVLERYSD